MCTYKKDFFSAHKYHIRHLLWVSLEIFEKSEPVNYSGHDCTETVACQACVIPHRLALSRLLVRVVGPAPPLHYTIAL